MRQDDQAVVTAQNPERLQDFTKDYPDTALTVSLDVIDQNSIEQAVSAAQKQFGAADNPPFRLLLGTDAVQFAETVMGDRQKEYADWREFSCQSDFDKA